MFAHKFSAFFLAQHRHPFYSFTQTRLMSFTDSGLEVRDRLWLKITIKNAFIGCDVVDWLYEKVSEGRSMKYCGQGQ